MKPFSEIYLTATICHVLWVTWQFSLPFSTPNPESCHCLFILVSLGIPGRRRKNRKKKRAGGTEAKGVDGKVQILSIINHLKVLAIRTWPGSFVGLFSIWLIPLLTNYTFKNILTFGKIAVRDWIWVPISYKISEKCRLPWKKSGIVWEKDYCSRSTNNRNSDLWWALLRC